MLNKYAAKNIPKIEPNPKINIYIRPSKGVFIWEITKTTKAPLPAKP